MGDPEQTDNEQLALGPIDVRTPGRGPSAASSARPTTKAPGSANSRKRIRATKRVEPTSTLLPIARVLIDSPLPHLDRPFDYLVPESMALTAVAGVRVKVRFAGRDLPAFVLERVATSDHDGALTPIGKVVSSEQVVTSEVAQLCRAVADRYAGTAHDVLRLAVPPRHADVEKAASPRALPLPSGLDDGLWLAYDGGPAFLHALDGGAPRAVLSTVASHDWAELYARALLRTAASGRGAIAVVPDARDLQRLDQALTTLSAGLREAGGSGSPQTMETSRTHSAGEDAGASEADGPGVGVTVAAGAKPAKLSAAWHTTLSADLGPRQRYRAFLAVLRGSTPIVIGTRAAAFAPVANLGLVAVWDDGDDLLAEPRAPYSNARDVLLVRADLAHCAALIGGYATTPEALRLVQTRWANPLAAPRENARAGQAQVRVVGDSDEEGRDSAARSARLPSLAWRAAREGLLNGPVLIQVPRRGYIPRVTCTRCAAPARCLHCQGPLQVASEGGHLQCTWCSRPNLAWVCSVCSGSAVRASVVGASRTADELGRAFPGVPIVQSGGDHVVDGVGSEPALVVSTPGAEPVAESGYSAALFLDAWAMLGLPQLRAQQEAVRRWFNAAALVRPATGGGRIVIVGADPSSRAVQALVRSDPVGYARLELDDRHSAGYPPAVRLAELVGEPAAVAEVIELADFPAGHDVLGPVALPPPSGDFGSHHDRDTVGGPPTVLVRVLVRVRLTDGAALAYELHRVIALRSARKNSGVVRVRIDPIDLG